MILQCIVNMVLWGKEQHMTVFNPFISENQVRIPAFFKQLSHPTDIGPTPMASIPQTDVDVAFNTIVTHISSYYDILLPQFPSENLYLLEALKSCASSPAQDASATPSADSKLPIRRTISSPPAMTNLPSSKGRFGSLHSFLFEKREKKAEFEAEKKTLSMANKKFAKALDKVDLSMKQGSSRSTAHVPSPPQSRRPGSRNELHSRHISGSASDAERRTLHRRHTYRDLGLSRDGGGYSSDTRDDQSPRKPRALDKSQFSVSEERDDRLNTRSKRSSPKYEVGDDKGSRSSSHRSDHLLPLNRSVSSSRSTHDDRSSNPKSPLPTRQTRKE